MKNKTLFRLLSSLFLITMIQVTNASQADIDNEINYYAEIFAGDDYKKQKKQYDALLVAGLSSPKIFDQVAEKLKNNEKLGSEFPAVKRTAFYAKILALSGNEKYRPLLLNISKYAKLLENRRVAKKSLIKLDNYALWNPLISNGLSDVPEGSLQRYRTLNILSVYDKSFLKEVRSHVIQIYIDKNFKPEIVSALAVRADYELKRQSNINKAQMETLAWLAKTIGQSGDLTYEPLLRKILKESEVIWVRKHVRRALRRLIKLNK